jgi:hypothetical protein
VVATGTIGAEKETCYLCTTGSSKPPEELSPHSFNDSMRGTGAQHHPAFPRQTKYAVCGTGLKVTSCEMVSEGKDPGRNWIFDAHTLELCEKLAIFDGASLERRICKEIKHKMSGCDGRG